MFAEFEAALADVLANETCTKRGAVEPFVAAVALVGVIRAAFEVRLIETMERIALSGWSGTRRRSCLFLAVSAAAALVLVAWQALSLP